MKKEFKWIIIKETGKSKSGKTKVFSVINKIHGDFLGTIKWNIGYRKYAFFIEDTRIIPVSFEEDCFDDLSSFLKELKDASSREEVKNGK